MAHSGKRSPRGRPPGRRVISGVEVFRDQSFCEVEAERLEREYRAGDPLALFQCAALWKAEGWPLARLPAWAIEALVEFSAWFYREYEAAAVAGRQPPSLDALAGLRGSKSPPVKKADRRGKARHYYVTYHAIVKEARRPYKKDKARWLCGPNRFRRGQEVDYGTGKYIGRQPRPVPVLNKRGEPTQAFATELYRSGRRHKTRGKYGNYGDSEANDDAEYRAARRLLRLARRLLIETDK